MSAVPEEVVRRLLDGAYLKGWRDACGDHMAQEKDASHPIGHSMRHEVGEIVAALDPNNLLGLQP